MSDHLAENCAVAVGSDGLLGVAGVEVHGGLGLLHSVAVWPSWRGRSVGSRLVRDRLAWVRSAGLSRVYLLTTDAAAFFERQGFARIRRESAPAAIQTCPEFASLCPQSAIVMMMVIQAEHPTGAA